jgi:hypothetical protein
MGNRSVAPIWLEACSDEIGDILTKSLPYNDYGEDLTEAVTAFVRMVAQCLVTDGSIAFEIQRGWDRSDQENPKLEGARLLYVDRKSMIKLGPCLCQIVPNAGRYDDSEDDNGVTQVIPLNRRRIIIFRPCRHYRKPLDRMRGGFRSVGRSEQQMMFDSVSGNQQEDFARVKRTYAIQFAMLSAPIGWNGRGLFRDYMADFHFIRRHLQWMRFCIEMRDAILNTLGGLFALIGAWRGENPKLRWGHLPTIQDVRESETKLMGGGTRFDEILKPFTRDASG